jgi:hypothetical protein
MAGQAKSGGSAAKTINRNTVARKQRLYSGRFGDR